MTNIFLDDIRQCPNGFELFRTGEELLEYLKKNKDQHFGIITFDHDLGSDVKDGYNVIKEIVRNPEISFTFDEFRFHTDNYQGFKNMVLYLRSATEHGAFPKSGLINGQKWNYSNGQGTPVEFVIGGVSWT